jgi:hypothetical protein
MVDNLNPTSQFHPYQPMDDVPQSERMVKKLGSADLNESLGTLRSYARRNPGKILGGLAAVAIGLGLLLKRSK